MPAIVPASFVAAFGRGLATSRDTWNVFEAAYSLRVVEVCGYGDDGVGDLLAQIVFGDISHLT
jgi:hypothetical protein